MYGYHFGIAHDFQWLNESKNECCCVRKIIYIRFISFHLCTKDKIYLWNSSDCSSKRYETIDRMECEGVFGRQQRWYRSGWYFRFIYSFKCVYCEHISVLFSLLSPSINCMLIAIQSESNCFSKCAIEMSECASKQPNKRTNERKFKRLNNIVTILCCIGNLITAIYCSYLKQFHLSIVLSAVGNIGRVAEAME